MDIRRLLLVFMAAAGVPAAADDFSPVPSSWKWVSGQEVIFSYDGTYADSTAFSYDVRSRSVTSAAFPLYR